MARIYQRKKIWYVDYRVKGRRIRQRAGTSKKVAELALKDVEVRATREEFGFLRHEISIEKLIDRFLEFNGTNHRSSTTKRYRAVTDHLRDYLRLKHPNILKLSQLTTEVLKGFKTFRKHTLVNPNGKGASDEKSTSSTRVGARDRTVNLELDGIKTMLNLAIRWDYLRENPMKLVMPLKESDKKLVRYLTKDECRKLLDASPTELYPVYFTFLNSGMSKSELENLQWYDIDLSRHKILIRRKAHWQPKTGDREIPIGDVLLNVLAKLKRETKEISESDLAFRVLENHSHNWVRTELIKIGIQAGIEGLTKVHTLRHTFASHLVMAGVDLPTIQKLMGHSDIETTMIYAHLAPDHLADAVNQLSFLE